MRPVDRLFRRRDSHPKVRFGPAGRQHHNLPVSKKFMNTVLAGIRAREEFSPPERLPRTRTITSGSSTAQTTKRKTKRIKTRERKRKRPRPPQRQRQRQPLKPRAATPPAIAVRQVATVARVAMATRVATVARRRLPPILRPRPTPLRASRRKAASDTKAPEQHVRCSGASLFRQMPQDATTAPAAGPIEQRVPACKRALTFEVLFGFYRVSLLTLAIRN